MKPYFERGGIVIYHGHWQDVLPVNCDLVVTDPPYGTGGRRRFSGGQGKSPRGLTFKEDWDDGNVAWLTAITAPAILTFWPSARALTLLNEASSLGYGNHRSLYYRKLDPMPTMNNLTRWSVEPIWALSKEPYSLHGGEDFYEASTPRLGRDNAATGHPYQKPLDLLLWLISKANTTHILDPFMGSGTTLVAAHQMGLNAIGIEQEEHWCEIAANRLSQAPLFVPEPVAPKAEPSPDLFSLLEEA